MSVWVCLSKCWPCNSGEHFEPPQWHTWADEDDIEHAALTGQEDPSHSRCGCWCADAPDE